MSLELLLNGFAKGLPKGRLCCQKISPVTNFSPQMWFGQSLDVVPPMQKQVVELGERQVLELKGGGTGAIQRR